MLGEEAEGWSGKHKRSEGLHKRSAEDCGKPLAPRQGSALSETWLPYPNDRARWKLLLLAIGDSANAEQYRQVGFSSVNCR